MSCSGVSRGRSSWIRRVATVVSSPNTSPTVARGPSDIFSNESGFQLFMTTEPKKTHEMYSPFIELEWLTATADSEILYIY